MSIKILNKVSLPRILIHIWWLSIFFILIGCSPTRKLLPNQYIVTKVEVHNHKSTGIAKENFEAFFKQRPNRRLFGKIDFFIWWWNLFNDEKMRQKKVKRNLKYDRQNVEKTKKYEKLNQERALEGKKAKTPKLKNKESSTLMESIRDIGEAPVLLDSQLTAQTRLLLNRYLFSKGFFNSKVTDAISISKNHKRATINYYLFPFPPYTINHIGYQIQDDTLRQVFLKDTIHSLLKAGDQYDLEKIQNERKRVTSLMLNNGYYYFESAFVEFDVDSNYNNRTVSMITRINQFAHMPSFSGDSLTYTDHTRYKIENIFIITDQLIGDARAVKFKDTIPTKFPGSRFLTNEDLNYKQFVIMDNIDLHQGRYFNKDTAELTYKQLLGIGIFKNVTIQFFPNEQQVDRLDCYIICSPIFKQAMTLETEGTNTSGNFGISGSLLYQNRNLVKGGELLEFKLEGSLLAQKSITSVDSGSAGNTNANGNPDKIFNTLQFGPEITFSVPRAYFPFSVLPFKKDMMPRTAFKTSASFQASLDYDRSIINFSYGFNYRSNQKRLRHDIIPIEINMVKATLTPAYERELIALNDAFLLNSFKDHLTILAKYILTWTSKESIISGKKTAYFGRVNFQSAGNILRPLFQLSGATPDTSGSYLINGVPFAQFLKTDIDFRIYIPVRAKSRIVYRLAGGIGVPLKNLSVLPYEQGFFSGGPNSVRAWRARTLGPGGYDPTDSPLRYDKIGDILLEGNFEYRFHIIKSFNGAMFVDAGNVWRLKPDESKPNGEFHVNTFLDQIAIGAGFGLRWDMNFFVLRLDFAVPLKDPKLPPGQRWTFDKKPIDYGILNFGIGYPF